MTIGAFARATGLSPRSLRSYDRLGLLSPMHIDPETSYRMYSHSQVRRGEAIRILRQLELPLLEIRDVLDDGSDARREHLLRHQRRLALRSVEIKYALGQLQALIEGKEKLVDEMTIDPVDEATHRRLAIDLFNRSWQLLERDGRTAAEDDELIHIVHAAAFHWGEIGNPARRARAENQCARVYAALGCPEAALHHAQRSLELVREGGDGFEDWDLASALEVIARAHYAAGSVAEAEHYAALARSELDKVTDPEDREIIESQIAELDL